MSKEHPSRRSFIASSVAASAAASFMPGLRAFTGPTPTGRGVPRDLLVYVFLRGGMDGLTV